MQHRHRIRMHTYKLLNVAMKGQNWKNGVHEKKVISSKEELRD